MLENGLVGSNRHRDWLFGDGCLELRNGLVLDGMELLDLNLTGVLGSFARSISGSVGIVFLEVVWVRSSVCHSSMSSSTVASVGGSITVHKLLL